jgi:nucleoside 2-deoxyribosyltransferase
VPVPKRVYLAGPEVFLADAALIEAAKKEICAEHGFEGVFPLDNDPAAVGAGADAVHRVSHANEGLIRWCDLMIANITPFRGPGLDGGTAFEIGFMRALGRPIFAYTNDGGLYTARARVWSEGAVRPRGDGAGDEDAEGLLIENLGGVDNAMIDGGVSASGGTVVVSPANGAERYRSMGGFTDCVVLAEALGG